MAEPPSQTLKTHIVAAYGVPGLPLAILTLPVYVFVPTLYSQELGLNLTLIGLVLLATRIFDGLSDPVIGVLSDRTSAKYGRRKTWMVLATPITVLALYQLLVPPSDAGINYLWVWGLILTLAWTGMVLPYGAWAAELSGDYHERSRLTAWREAFVLIGTMVAAGLPAVLTLFGMPSLSTHAKAIAIFVAIALPISIGICAWAVPDKAQTVQKHLPWKDGLQVLRGNRTFWRLIGAYLVNATANGLPGTLFIAFVTYRIGMPDMYGPLLFVYFLCGFVAIPFWVALSKRYDKHRTWCFAMLWAAGAFIWTPFVVGQGDIVPFFIITILSGFGVGADLVLPPSIQADVVDLDRLQSGKQRTGLYFALWGLATKTSLALAVGLSFPILDWVGFDAEAISTGAQNSDVALNVLAALYAFVPVLFKLCAISIMWNFPLDAKQQREVRAELEAQG